MALGILIFGLIAGFMYVIADTAQKKEAFKGIALACFAGAIVAVFVL